MKRTLFAAGTIALAISVLAITTSHSQTPTASPSPTPSPTPAPVAIKAGRLLDVKTGKIANNVFILVEGHRIKSITDSAPEAAQVIDLSKALVMPGMVDCHAHILGDLSDQSPG